MLVYFQSFRKNFKLAASHIVAACFFGYFVFHMMSGARGAISWVKLNKEIASLEEELKDLKEENDFLENKINLIRDNNLDVDLLEEQAISVLGFSHENDVIVLLPRGH
ncbi:MAG: septum formation initiator family protein [Holosporaceae bacterium]|jgi:cell division protein FtsB|nr:septum formation initiator family protein [Holosporaceae bacterium]